MSPGGRAEHIGDAAGVADLLDHRQRRRVAGFGPLRPFQVHVDDRHRTTKAVASPVDSLTNRVAVDLYVERG